MNIIQNQLLDSQQVFPQIISLVYIKYQIIINHFTRVYRSNCQLCTIKFGLYKVSHSRLEIVQHEHSHLNIQFSLIIPRKLLIVFILNIIYSEILRCLSS